MSVKCRNFVELILNVVYKYCLQMIAIILNPAWLQIRLNMYHIFSISRYLDIYSQSPVKLDHWQLYTPPLPIQKVHYRAAISWCSPRAVCSCIRHLRPFILNQSKKIWGGYNAARGLISRNIAIYSISMYIHKYVHKLSYLRFYIYL